MSIQTVKTPLYIFGEVLFDCFPDSSRVLGGAPFNVAWHLQAFGLTPQLISAVGNDVMGSEIKKEMKNWALSDQFVQEDTEHSTGVVDITINNGEPSYGIREDAAFDYISTENLPTLDRDSLLYHGTLAIRNNTSFKSLQKIVDEYNPKRFIDVNLRDPWWEYDKTLRTLQYADFVKLNFEELTALSGLPYIDDWIESAKEFKLLHNIVNLLVTRGKDGAILIDESGEIIMPTEPPESASFIDSVGAGDAFSALMLLGIVNEWDWLTTIERAQLFASFIVSRRGAICSDAAVYHDFRKFWGML